MRRLLAIVVVSFVLLLTLGTNQALAKKRVASPSPSPAPVATIDVPKEEVNPEDGTGYWIKRIKEKLWLFFSFSDVSKLNFQKKLVNSRFSELKYIIENNQMAYFEKATQRYFTTVGQLTNFALSKKLNSEYGGVSDLLSSHLPILVSLRDKFKSTTAEWRFVEDDINYVKGYISSLTSSK